MGKKRIRRMVGIRKGGVAVIAVQYEDGEVMTKEAAQVVADQMNKGELE